MNIDNLELTMDEIYEMVTGVSKEIRSSGVTKFTKYYLDLTLKENVLRIPISGYDFFGRLTWNCKKLIEHGITSKEEVEKYVKYKVKFVQAAFDVFECFRDVEDEEDDDTECASEQARWLEGK